MPYYPVNLDLKDRRCVVIGGGAVAERKAEMLVTFGADVVVVAPKLTVKLHELAAAGSIRHVSETYCSRVLEGAFLAIAATNDREANEAISRDARERGILINVVDDPQLCTFFVPAIVRRGDLVISISTSGKSPAMARKMRETLESEFGPEYGELADVLGDLREEVKAKYPDPADRNLAYIRILDHEVLDLLGQGRRDEAVEKARKCI